MRCGGFLPCSHVWIRAEWSGVPAVHRGGGRARRQRARQDHPPPGRAHGRPARSTALNGSPHLFFLINTGNAVFSSLRSPSQHFLRLAPRNRERGSRSAAGRGPGASTRPRGARPCVRSALGQRQGRGRHVCVGPPGVTSGGGRAEASRGPLTARGSAARQPRGFCFPRRTPSRGGRRSRAADDAGEGERRASGCGLRACQIPGGIAGPGVGVLRGSACGPYDVGG